MTPSQAKYAIKKALESIIDPDLKRGKKSFIWKYFNNRCAYCSVELDKTKHNGHIDHLVSKGGNHISNQILSCQPCNDEKREENWEDFLKMKCKNNNVAYKKRSQKIEEWKDSKWRDSNSKNKLVISKKNQKILQEEIRKIKTQIEESIKILRKIKQKPIE